LKFYNKNGIGLDILIINDQSIKNFDYVFLSYNRDKHYAPIITIARNKDYCPNSITRLNADVKILKEFTKKHDIFIYYETTLYNKDFKYHKSIHNNLIKRIRNCGEGNCISDDIFLHVSFAYAALYKHENSAKRKILT